MSDEVKLTWGKTENDLSAALAQDPPTARRRNPRF